MDITSINSQTASAAHQQNTKGKSELGQDQFLQLLVAQMRNQDPTNPLEGAEFASQLAQFNSVEQLISVNEGLSNLRGTQDLMSASLTNSLAAALTGKHVRAISDNIHLDATGDSEINFKLKSAAETVEVVIRDSNGTEMRRESFKGMASGDNNWIWDGKNNSGERLGEGQYQVEVIAKSGDEPINSLVFVEGTASKVRFTANGVLLLVNDIEVPIGDVEEVGSDNS